MSKKHLHRILIVIAILILMISIAFSAYLLVFNYKNVHLFRKAERNFLSNTPASLNVAESQLLQLIRNDPDNEQAFLMLSRIAERRKKISGTGLLLLSSSQTQSAQPRKRRALHPQSAPHPGVSSTGKLSGTQAGQRRRNSA